MRPKLSLAFLAFLLPSQAQIIIDHPSTPDTLYAIGDIHGDLHRLESLLAATDLAANGHWTGRRSVLVVTGDMIDKGPSSVAVLQLLASLRSSAPKSGGQVILLAGNHETEFLAEPKAKKSKDFVADLRNAGFDPDRTAACEGDIGAVLCSLPYAARIGDWFFSHAGNTDGRTLARLTSDIAAGIKDQGFAAPQFLDANSILEARLGGSGKWFGSRDERHTLERNAAALKVHHIVQGHQHNTVKFEDGTERRSGEMFQRWGLLFLIDVGMSTDIGDSTGAVLRIQGGKATAICANGTETLLWNESSPSATGRAAPCP